MIANYLYNFRAMLKGFFFKSIRRELILGVALVHAVLMTLFIVDLVKRQESFLYRETESQANALAAAMAASGNSWILAGDFVGLKEIVKMYNNYPGLEFAMFVSPDGRVIGHSQTELVGKYLTDSASIMLLNSAKLPQRIDIDSDLVDCAVPIFAGGTFIGWARVAINHDAHIKSLKEVMLNGAFYILLAIIVGSVLAVLIARQMTSKLVALTNFSSMVQRGNRNIRADEAGTDELSVLSKGFNRMIEAIDETENSLVLARIQAETANKTKNEFLANMSHEIRTPINGILGMLQIAEEYDMEPQLREHITIALSSGRSLLSLINDILSISQIEAGKVPIRYEEFRLQDCLKSIYLNFSFLLEPRGIKLTIVTDEVSPELLLGDEGRLRQILFNLIGNSLKFSHDNSEIRLEISRLAFDEIAGRIRLLFQVVDQGIGIPENKLNIILDPFSQVDNSFTRRYQGAGLGLAIVQKLIRLMHGTLAIDSEVNHGTTVAFALDFGIANSTNNFTLLNDISELPRECPLNLRILLVEDDKVNHLVVKRFLEKYGYIVTSAYNGKEGLAYLINKQFDLIIMDIQMPELDGYEAIKIIRNSPEFADKSNIPVIALTAYAMIGDKHRLLSAGFNEYLAKPVERELLQLTVCKLFKYSN